MATPIGSPRVPSTVGSSLVTPAARDDVEPDDGAHAPRCASHASLARSANASLRARALPALPFFSASAAFASHPSSLLTDSLSCPLSLRRDPQGARALSDRGPPISDPASFRPPCPDSYGPALGRGGSIPITIAHGLSAPPHNPGATIDAAGHSAPAHDNGRRLAGPGPDRAAINHALGPEASAHRLRCFGCRWYSGRPHLEILRNGVSDIAETLEGKIRDMWDHIQAELRSERTHQQHVSDVARERRIADHATIEDRFERMTMAINERLIEFDQRIFRLNEDRAGSISLEVQETIRII